MTAWPKLSQPSEVHGAIVTLGFHLLIGEVLHRLIVEETVDGLAVRIRVGIVHVPADGDAPVGRLDGEIEIGPDHHHQHADIADAEEPDKDDGHHEELDDSGHDVEHGETDDRFDALGATLDNAGEAAGAARQMEAQRQAMDVMESFERQFAHGMLANACEEDVAQLLEGSVENVAEDIGDDEHDGNSEAEDQLAIGIGAIEAVDDALIGKGNEGSCNLAQDQSAEGEDHLHAQVGSALGPHIGPEIANGREYRAFVRANGRLLFSAVLSH